MKKGVVMALMIITVLLSLTAPSLAAFRDPRPSIGTMALRDPRPC